MFIIGYIADKTDFGRKPVQKKEKVKPEKEVLPVEPKGVEEMVQETPIEDNEVVPAEVTESNDVPQEEVKEEFDQSLFEPLETENVEVATEPVVINEEEPVEVEQPQVEEEDNIWNF